MKISGVKGLVAIGALGAWLFACATTTRTEKEAQLDSQGVRRPVPQGPVSPANDRLLLGDLAAQALQEGCPEDASESGSLHGVPTRDIAALRPPVPRVDPKRGSQAGEDVAIYVAHPDDETMYAGGTMSVLVRRGKRVSLTIFSHGEGGRILEDTADGGVHERRDIQPPQLATMREAELQAAVGKVNVPYKFMYNATDFVDFGYTPSCKETLARWTSSLPGALAGMIERVAVDIRQRRPRVVMTMDPRDDPQGSHHGHHKALGVVVDLAARIAADPSFALNAPPHAVEEFITFAPRGLPADITIETGPEPRFSMIREYKTQFTFPWDPMILRNGETFERRWLALYAPLYGVFADMVGITH